MCNVIEPIFEQQFIADSYANRIGKGSHQAVDRCQTLAKQYRYVLRCDIVKHFPSLDHAVLLGVLQQTIQEEAMLWLMERIIQSDEGVLRDEYEMVYFPGDDLFAVNRPRGLPIGNLTSQFWSNVYLTPLDHFVVRELGCPAYLRYVDDFALVRSRHQRQQDLPGTWEQIRWNRNHKQLAPVELELANRT